MSATYLVLLVLPLYPTLIGIVSKNSALTLINDFALYLLLLLKIPIFTCLFSSKDFRAIFIRWINRYLSYSMFMVVIMLFIAYSLKFAGFVFYFQAPLEITFVTAYLAAQGRSFGVFFLLIYAFLSAKRMILIGVCVTIVSALLIRNKYAFISLFKILLIGLALSFILSLFDLSQIAGLSKVDAALNIFSGESDGFMESFSRLDPSRYTEIVSLWNSIESSDFIFGQGFGYRYQYDLSLLDYRLSNYESHSNSHFTPLGVLSKFGIFGSVLWLCLFTTLLIRAYKYRKKDAVAMASFLFLISLIVQSFFAYALFVNVFLPVIAGYILSLPYHRRKPVLA